MSKNVLTKKIGYVDGRLVVTYVTKAAQGGTQVLTMGGGTLSVIVKKG